MMMIIIIIVLFLLISLTIIICEIVFTHLSEDVILLSAAIREVPKYSTLHLKVEFIVYI